MASSYPFLFALLIFAAFFVVSVKNGVLNLLASGIAVAFAMAAFFCGVQFLPGLAEQFMDVELEWKKTAMISGGAAIFVFLITRIVGGFVLKGILGPDAFMNSLVDGGAGGIVSLFPSFVIVIFLFCCFRIAGTLHELNYTASLARDEVATMTDQIPPYPWTSSWRDSIEDVPLMAPGLDLIDPFSNRANRNAAAFAIMNQSSLVRSYLHTQPDTGELAASSEVLKINQAAGVAEALEKQDRVKLVLNPAVLELADDPSLHPLLRRLRLQSILKGYVKSLKISDPSRIENLAR